MQVSKCLSLALYSTQSLTGRFSSSLECDILKLFWFSRGHHRDARCICLLCFRLVGFLDPGDARLGFLQSIFENMFV